MTKPKHSILILLTILSGAALGMAAPALTAVAGEGRVALDWSDNVGAASYSVYRSANANGPFQRVARTEPSSYLEPSLTPGTTYHYAVTAVDGSGNETVFSNIVAAQPTGIHLAPQADAYVHGGSFANMNFGSNAQLRCKADAANVEFVRQSYLRFNLSSLPGTIASAVLRLKVASTTGSGDFHTAHAVANDGWTETGITWNNKPAAGSALATAVSPAVNGWIELDVKNQVTSELAGDLNFSTVLISGGSQLVGYHSKEAGNADDRPELVVTTLTGTVPAPPTGLNATYDGTGNIVVSWDDQSAEEVNLFRLYRSSTPSGPYMQRIDTSATSFVDNDVVLGQTYYYRLAAINANGNLSEDADSVEAEGLVVEALDCFDGKRLATGTPKGGIGWSGGWEALSGGGLEVFNGRIDQTSAAGSTRALAVPFSLNGPGDHYFSFFARTDATGAFNFKLKQTAPGPYVRWAFARNENGSVTIQGGTAQTTSAAGIFAANKEYLVVSKFRTNGDIASVKLIDPANPGDYPSEPSTWDLSASLATGVTIDRLDIEVGAGRVMLDDITIGRSYVEVIGALASEVPLPLSPANAASSPYAFPTFSWSEHREQFREMDAPVNYTIEIASDADFSAMVDTDLVGLPRYVHDRPFAEGTYYWRVRSVTNAGRVSAWSATRSFTITPHDETVVVNYDAMAADHWNAVQTAVAQTAAHASQGKSVKLVFPAGDYHFPDTSLGYLIALDGVSRIHIEGMGAQLHFTSRKQTLIRSIDSEEVSVSGFRISYAKGALRIQGTVAAVNPDTKTVTLAIEPGFPDFTASNNQVADIFLLLDPVIDGRQKTGSNSFYRMVANGSSQNPDGNWTVALDRAAIPEWQVGDRFVYHFRAGSPVLTNFGGSRSISLHGLDIGGWGNMMIGAAQGRESLFNILHVDTFHQDGKWMVGNADGVHLRGHKVGPWIEGTRIQSIGDDGIALYARPASMSSAKPGGNPKAAVFVSTHFNLEAGDEVAFFEPTAGTILLETRVVTVQPDSSGWLVEFENELPDNMNFSGALVDITQVWNRSKSCGDFMIRNGRMLNNRRYATVFRARRGIVENMEYRGASTSSIIFVNETPFPNGLYASEIILRNNLIEDSGFLAVSAAPVAFRFNGHNIGVQNIGPRNLLIEHHIFAACGAPEITMNHARNVVIRNNRTSIGGGQFADATHSAAFSERIVASMDDVSDDLTPPAAPAGLTATAMADAISLDWNRGSDLDAVFYQVYRATLSGGPYTLQAGNLLASEYVDHTADSGMIYYYAITASDVAGNESGLGNETSAIFGTDYQVWSANWPGADLSAPDDDFDGDGLNNNEERIWGLDPTDGASMNPIVKPIDATGTFRYTRRDPALTGLRFIVSTSPDLRTWTPDDGAVQVPEPDVPAVGIETVEVTLSPLLMAEPQLFVRVTAAE